MILISMMLKRVIIKNTLKFYKERIRHIIFLDIQIYHDPEENTETKEISQAVIIDRIVKNCMKAQKEEQFRDIFVTAPTGAGEVCNVPDSSNLFGRKK